MTKENEKQLTACQILINYMESNYHLTEESRMEFKQALATERQQLIDAVKYGGNYYDGNELIGETYYNNTFKTQ